MSKNVKSFYPNKLWFIFFSFPFKSGQSKSFLCKCSFIEIYNEQIYDLLDTASASLFLRENIKKGVFVEGAVEKFVNSAAEAYQVWKAYLLRKAIMYYSLLIEQCGICSV